MPNTGKPSLDCHLCRSRRVKCDLARPGCQRCLKYGAECPGYRDQQDLMFRNADPARYRKKKSRAQQQQQQQQQELQFQTQPAATSSGPLSPVSLGNYPRDSPVPGTPSGFLCHDVGRERSAAVTGSARVTAGAASSSSSSSSSPPSPSSASSCSTPSSSSSSELAWQLRSPAARAAEYYMTMQQPQLYMTVSEHWRSHSVPLMLNIYAPISFLSDMYSTAASDGPLAWAAHLFARTYITNLQYPTAISRESYDGTQRELGMYLGKTLSAVCAALQDPAGALRDDILATVWTLVNYETLIGSLDRTHLTSHWHTHARGLYSILKARGEDRLKSKSSRAAFWTSYTLVQIDCLASSIPCPEETTRWFEVIKSSMTPGEQFPVIVSDFIRKVAGLQAAMLPIVRGGDFVAASDEYDALIGGIVEAEDKAEDAFTRVTDSPNPMNGIWLQIYYSALVKGYHVAQIYINFLSHYDGCVTSPRELERQRDHCVQRVRTAAQKILDFIPHALQPLISSNNKSPRMLFGAMMVIWPLTAVYITPLCLPEQIATAEDALYFIGRELGIKQALCPYPGTSVTRLPPQAIVPRGFGGCELVEWVGRLGR